MGELFFGYFEIKNQYMTDEEKKISANRQKKIEIVSGLSEKFGKAKAVVFTNYQGLTHKQIEEFKKAIKPLQAEYVVAKNSLLTLALNENKIKLSEEQSLTGQTGTLFLYDDIISPLKALSKVIKELNLPNVKFGIMEEGFITDEQVLKLSTLPGKEVLLSQLVGGLKSPIFGLHRALYWNLQKFVMTLKAVADKKPVTAAASHAPTSEPAPVTPANELSSTASEAEQPAAIEPEAIPSETPVEKASEEPVDTVNTPEPETIQEETPAEKAAEEPEIDNPTIEAESSSAQSAKHGQTTDDNKSENPENKGGEN